MEFHCFHSPNIYLLCWNLFHFLDEISNHLRICISIRCAKFRRKYRIISVIIRVLCNFEIHPFTPHSIGNGKKGYTHKYIMRNQNLSLDGNSIFIIAIVFMKSLTEKKKRNYFTANKSCSDRHLADRHFVWDVVTLSFYSKWLTQKAN